MPDDRSHIAIHRGISGGYHWTAYDAHGECVSCDGRAYPTRWGARRAARRFLPGWTIINLKT